MKEEVELKKMFFDLNDSFPLRVLFNVHRELTDYWFDMHYEVEVGIVLSGKMKRQYLKHEMELAAGDIWICGIWEPHGFELQETPCEVVVFVVEPDFLIKNNLMNINLFSAFQVEPKLRPKVTKKKEVLQIAEKTKEKLYKKNDSNWARIIFLELMLTLWEDWTPPSKNNFTYKLPKSIQPALRMVFMKKELISTKKAALECNMSPSGFRSRFKEFMGVSFSEFALNYRIKGAIAQIKKSKDTRETIAQIWGFTDASHLQHCIKKFQDQSNSL